jgi:hypothetical protein
MWKVALLIPLLILTLVSGYLSSTLRNGINKFYLTVCILSLIGVIILVLSSHLK